MTEAAYSTDNPEAVSAYRDACARRADQARRTVAAVRELGADPDQIYITGDGIGAPALTGLTPLGDHIPDGWRIVGGRLEPRRGKPGEHARQWLADHQPVDVRGIMEPFGLPRAAWVPGSRTFGYRYSTPLLFEHDGTLWAHYTAEPGVSDSGFDKTPCTWDRRKLSEFHAAREAHEAAIEAEQAAA